MLPINVPSGQFKGTPLSRKRLTVFKMFAFSLIKGNLIVLSRKIKVWDLQAALDPRAPASTLCLRTLVVCDLPTREVVP